MWFELINTAIAAAGLGLASFPLFKKTDDYTFCVVSHGETT
ncbi:hypothetical protein [uncultured Tateyamaria sp.]|nr:hypothetical protein [uncultured Tateyamaria sp.]